jgi:oligoendopeptidase F
MPPRAEIPVQYRWDTYSVFPSDEAWEEAFRRAAADIPAVGEFSGRLAEGPAVLADCLERYESTIRRVGHLFIYASSFHNVDTADQVASARNDRARGLFAGVVSRGAYIEPEMLAIGFATLRQWIAEEPRLSHYGHYVDELERRQAHVRSAEVEELLGAVSDPFRTATSAHGILADADLTFAPARGADGQEREIAQGNIDALLMDADREVRRTAWESYADAHLATRNTMATIMATGVKQRVFTARARRYETALEASLDANNIPVAVYHNVVDTFRANLHVWHKYWRIRRRALGYDALHVYDIKAPLSEAKPRVSLDEAVEHVAAGLQPLGKEYVDTVRRGVLEERWVDFLPNKGKRAGAFSSGMPGTLPFILMSFTNDLESVSTLAHELGHSMHSYLAWRTQPFVYADYSIFAAEVPSNLSQALVRRHLLETHEDPEFQIAVIEEAMSNFHRYFFLMPTLARFELEMHTRVERGEALTAQSLMELMTALFREGYGDEVAVDDERVGITWAEFPTHLYLNYYVFQYTTGISAAHALAEPILAGETGALERYLAFLSAGSSVYPLDGLRAAGVDMTTPAPIEAAFRYLEGLVDRLDGLV